LYSEMTPKSEDKTFHSLLMLYRLLQFIIYL
jgi:hypothetical protein